MQIYIGIDPSINSTGLCIQVFNNDKRIYEHFYIIKPDKLTKKEQKAQEENEIFDYIIYNKYDLSAYKNENHLYEYYKTLKMICLIESISNVIFDEIEKFIGEKQLLIYAVIEGISYGSSTRTKSVFDLAGLNYLIRYKMLKHHHFNDFIIVPPSELKKFITGKGNVTKEVIIDFFTALYPTLNIPKIDDIADAYFMSLYAKHIKNKCSIL